MLHHPTYRLLSLLLVGLLTVLAGYAQPGRFTAPVKLPEVINSTAEEGMPYLAPDGQTFYFVRTFHPDNVGGEGSGQDVWSSTFEDGQWSVPENTFSFNDEENNAVTGISSTGDTLYLLGTYSKKAQLKKGLALTTDPEGVWKRPSPVSIPGLNIKGDFYGLFMNETADRLVISMNGKNSLGEEDLYICVKRKSGRWSRPIHLGDTVNSSGYEISPFLAEDGRTLYFATNGHGGLGSVDIFMTQRLDSSWTNWSIPVNLGPGINSPYFDAYFTIRGKDVFFASNRDGQLSEIYKATDLNYREGIGDQIASDEAPLQGRLEFNGRPAPLVRLLLKDENNITLRTSTTDANGMFDFDKLTPDKNYMVVIDAEDVPLDVRLFVMNLTGNKVLVMNRTNRTTFTYWALDRDRIDRLVNLTEQDLAFGRTDMAAVFEFGGQPTSLVGFQVRDADSSLIEEVTTDRQGGFLIHNLAQDQEYIISLADGQKGQYSGGRLFMLSPDGKRMVVLWGRDNGTFVFRTLPADGRIALSSLPESDDGDITAMRGLFEYRKLPASGVPLELRDANGNVVQTTITDGLGRFDFPGLTPGKDYTVVLAITDSSLAQKGQLFILNESGNKVAMVRKMQGGTFNYRTLSRDQVAGLPSLEEDDAAMDVQLTRISGIFEYDKLPAAGVALYLVDENDQIIQVVTTDAQGRFDFSRLPADQNYLIRIGGEDGTILDDARLFITDGGGKKVAIVQKFAAGEFKFKPLSRDASGSLATMEEEEVALEAGLSAITGVFTYDKLPASGVTLFLVDENDQIIQEVVTDARGRFDFSRLPADKNYLIKVKGEDGDLLDEGVIYLTDSRGETVDEVKEVADGEFQYRTLARQGAAPLESLAEEEAFPDESLTRLWGMFEHGNIPASGVTLYLVDDNDRIIQVVTTDARGRFDFKKLPSDQDYMIVMATEDGVLLEDGALYRMDETGNKQAMQPGGKGAGKDFRYRVLSREEIGALAAVSEADAAMALVRNQIRKTNPNRVKVDAARHIKFGFNVYLLTRNDKAILEEHIVPQLRQSPALGVEIHGHTDAVGSAYNNQKMSEYRAEAIRRYLMKQGVASSRIITRGFGEDEPIASNGDKDGRRLNRRVEIYFRK